MLFNQLVSLTYNEARETYPEFEDLNRVERTIVMHNSAKIDSMSNNSDIIVYYDIVENSKPLLIIERIPQAEYSLKALKMKIKQINESISGYKVVLSTKKSKGYYDVLVVAQSIYSSICEDVTE